MKRQIFIMMVILVFISIPVMAKDFNVTLSWNANSEPDLAGYRVYRSEISGTYENPIAELGLVTSYNDILTVNDGESKIFYYVVTAYDTNALESDYSNEVCTNILDGNVPPAPVNNLIINIQVAIALQKDGTYSIAMREIN